MTEEHMQATVTLMAASPDVHEEVKNMIYARRALAASRNIMMEQDRLQQATESLKEYVDAYRTIASMML